MPQHNPVNQRWRELRNQNHRHASQSKRNSEKANALKTIGQRAADGIAERQSDQDHANLADPNVKGTAEVFREVARADNLQNHDRKPAQENEQGGSSFNHTRILASGSYS